jgi:aspartate racemase
LHQEEQHGRMKAFNNTSPGMSKIKRMGILGGMSWVSTLKYYELINLEILRLSEGTSAADLVIWSFDTLEIEPLIAAGKWQAIGRLLQQATDKLINCEVEGILIASNTIHRVVEQELISAAVPLIHIRDSLLREIKRRNLAEIGFIGTSATMKGDVYRNLVNGSTGINVVLPPESSWAHLDDMIFNRLCRGKITQTDKAFLEEILRLFENKHIAGTVLGCTELGLLKPSSSENMLLLDTTEIHAYDAARWSFR